jgi:hypothetical protein
VLPGLDKNEIQPSGNSTKKQTMEAGEKNFKRLQIVPMKSANWP